MILIFIFFIELAWGKAWDTLERASQALLFFQTPMVNENVGLGQPTSVEPQRDLEYRFHSNREAIGVKHLPLINFS